MSTFSGGEVPFAVPNANYSPAAFADLLTHPELNAEAERDNTLRHMMSFGRAALLTQDLVSYEGWMARIDDLAATVQAEGGSDSLVPFYDNLAQLRFDAVMQGHADSLPVMQELLDNDPAGTRLGMALQSAAAEGMDPTHLINRFAKTPEATLNAWGDFYDAAKVRLETDHDQVAYETSLSFGDDEYIEQFLYAKYETIGGRAFIRNAQRAFELVEPDQKIEVIFRFAKSIEHACDPDMYQTAVAFATSVNMDPMMEIGVKQELSQVVSLVLEAASDKTLTLNLDLGTLRGSQAIAEDVSIQTIIDDMENFALIHQDAEEPEEQLRDGLLKRVASLYAAADQPSRVAAVIAQIIDSNIWLEAASDYIATGGDPNLLVLGDELQRFEVRAAQKSSGAMAPDQREWSLRRDAALFLGHVHSGEYELARELLLAMTAEAPYGSRSRDELYVDLVDRLLTADPTSSGIIAHDIKQNLAHVPGYAGLDDVFIKVGDHRVTAAKWRAIQTASRNRREYFREYAAVILMGARAERP